MITLIMGLGFRGLNNHQYYVGLYRGYVGIMEKKMETSTLQ